MAISHFIITRLPDTSVTPKIGLMSLAINQLYDIAMESNLKFERIPSLDGLYVSENVKFKAYDESLQKYGNEAQIDLTWKENDLGILPTSGVIILEMLNDQSVNLLPTLPINGAVEFIEIVSISGVNNLFHKGSLLAPGQRLEPKEMLEAIYETNLEGGGFPYAVITYKAGRNNISEAVEYTLTVNVISIAEMISISQTSETFIEQFDNGAGGIEELPVIYETTLIDIKKGYQGGTAELSFVINAPFLTSTSVDKQSEVSIEVNGIEYLNVANGTVNAAANLNENGYAQVKVTSKIVKDDASETGQIDVTLLSINQDPALVSGTANTVSIVSNF